MLFPGGGQDLSSWTSPWMLAAGTMFNQTVAQNANGQFFPLWVSVCRRGARRPTPPLFTPPGSQPSLLDRRAPASALRR